MIARSKSVDETVVAAVKSPGPARSGVHLTSPVAGFSCATVTIARWAPSWTSTVSPTAKPATRSSVVPSFAIVAAPFRPAANDGVSVAWMPSDHVPGSGWPRKPPSSVSSAGELAAVPCLIVADAVVGAFAPVPATRFTYARWPPLSKNPLTR